MDSSALVKRYVEGAGRHHLQVRRRPWTTFAGLGAPLAAGSASAQET